MYNILGDTVSIEKAGMVRPKSTHTADRSPQGKI